MNSSPRVPTLLTPGFTEPVAAPIPMPPLPADGDGLTIETSTIVKSIVGDNFGGETSVYVTKKRWRALDLYVNPQFQVAANVWLSVFVYAIVQGQKTLVASGRLFVPGQGPQPLIQFVAPQWLAAARSVASVFEVTATISSDLVAPTPFSGQVQFTVAASDEAVEPPIGLGVVTEYAAPAGQGFVSTLRWPKARIVRVQAYRYINEDPEDVEFALLSLNYAGGRSVPFTSWPLVTTIWSSESTAVVVGSVVDCAAPPLPRAPDGASWFLYTSSSPSAYADPGPRDTAMTLWVQ